MHLCWNFLSLDVYCFSSFLVSLQFDPDPSKQAQEVIFFCKLQKSTHPPLSFNSNSITQSPTQKHLRMFMDTNLDFQWHLENILNKANEMISLLYKPHNSAYNPFVNLILTGGVSCTIRHTTFSTKIGIYSMQLSTSHKGPCKRDIYNSPLWWARFGNSWKKKMVQETMLLL